ncbi:MAG: RNA polymerase sigma factor [Solirubrobacteraceae bacterium]
MAFVLNSEGLVAVYRAQAEALLVYFTRRCYDGQMALDLVGETFARAHGQRDRFRGGSQREAEAWVWAIARHALADALRRGRAERRAIARLGAQVPLLAEDEAARVERLAGLEDMRTTVGEALERLAPEYREALRLRVVLELDYEAVAGRLGISQTAARARVSRALRSLSVALDSAEGVR